MSESEHDQRPSMVVADYKEPSVIIQLTRSELSLLIDQVEGQCRLANHHYGDAAKSMGVTELYRKLVFTSDELNRKERT